MSRLSSCVVPSLVCAVLVALMAVGTLASGAAGQAPAPASAAEASPQAPATTPAKPQPSVKPQSAARSAPAAAAAAPTRAAAIAGLRFREIGPAAMGGRTDDFAVVESDPSIVYAGLASGGVWKTTNAGTTWTPVFDKEEVSTIGDVTVAPSDPSVVWVGTGEPNNRQSSSWGNGVYKSTDAGQTWKHMGLRETHHIGRIVIHPANPDVVYVAALGRLWGPSKERGLYRTSDGGATWKLALFVSEDTGVVDVAMDPASPDTLYAAAYQRRRTVFGFAGSGPEGGIYKTTDGGVTWKRLAKGLPWDPDPPRPRPTGGPPAEMAAMFGIAAAPAPEPARPAADPGARQEIGRIGLDVYRRDSRVVYALVEHASGGIFRSDDKGETWQKMSDTNPRPAYYSKVRVDPTNDQRIWVLGAQMFTSEDGGKTFATNVVQRIHGDYHALWINPANAGHMIAGSDGGIHWSWDRGRTWDFVNTIAIGQFYEIGVDMRQPYYICGGLQDNNTWCGPSMSTNPRGISNGDWFTIGGGDGFYAQIDPNDSNTVYAESQDGNLLRRNLRTGESRSIRPQPAEGEKAYRFQWNSPIVISTHDSKTLYYGGNVVFRSPDRGDSWARISPDLTTGADRNALPIMGRVPDRQTRSRHDGVQNWPAITTLAESSLDKDVLWAGTDDGLLHVTRDGGKTWTNVYDKLGAPKGLYVSRIVASRHAVGRAFATVDGHRSNDFGIHVFATADFGQTWTKITAGLPENNGVINVVREHPKNPDLLFAGGEYGAFVSFNRGASWTRLKLNLPTVPVDDIAIHPRENDLILATHGRSIWILDDLAPLAEMDDAVLAKELHLFSIRPAVQWRPWGNTGSTGHKVFLGENPPSGAIISYYLKAKPADGTPVKITVQDKSGKAVRSLDGTASVGVNRVAWDTRMESPIPPAPPGSGGSGFGGLGFFGAGGGPRVDPGQYTVKVTAGSHEASGTVEVQEDPRITTTDAERAARWAVLDTLMPKAGPLTIAQRTITQMRSSLVGEMEGWKRPAAAKVPDEVAKAAEALLKKIDDVYPSFATPPSEQPGLGDAGPPVVERPTPYPQRMLRLYGDVANQSAAPTAWQKEQAQLLAAKADELVAVVRGLTADLGALNKLMNEAGMPHITVQAPGGARR